MGLSLSLRVLSYVPNCVICVGSSWEALFGEGLGKFGLACSWEAQFGEGWKKCWEVWFGKLSGSLVWGRMGEVLGGLVWEALGKLSSCGEAQFGEAREARFLEAWICLVKFWQFWFGKLARFGEAQYTLVCTE